MDITVEPFSSKLVLPQLYCPFPPATNRHADALSRHTERWATSFGLIEGPEAKQKFDGAKYPLLISLTHPRAHLEGLKIVSDWNAWLFMLDDQSDASELGKHPDDLADLHCRILDVLAGAPTHSNDSGTIRALGEWYLRIEAHREKSWFHRFRERVKEYLDACIWEASNRANRIIPSTAEYMQRRLSSGALYTVFELLELSDCISLPDEVRKHACIDHLTRLANGVVCWSNDIFSYRKEANSGDVHNLVVVLQHEHSIPTQDALYRVAGINDADVRSFLFWESRVPRFGGEVDAQVERHLMAMRAWMRGNIDWSTLSGRYQTPDDGH